jgi:hypothetical protein
LCLDVTVTVVLHDACCGVGEESVAEQLTWVVPTWNFEPDAGEQELVTGASPPVTAGLP